MLTLSTLAAALVLWHPAPSADLVQVQVGDVPLILSAPHGGTLDIPDSTPRKGEGLPTGASGFFAGRDPGTEELAFEVAKLFEQETGKKPYFVVARFHRKFLDCNRPATIAYEDPFAQKVYETYHGTLAKFSKEVGEKFGGGLVVDIHGQGSSAKTVFRGTKNGASTEKMRKRFGEGIHVGPESVFGRLKALGWTVFPEGEGKEQAGFTGGFITQTYGGKDFPTDAIQFEFGADYRTSDEKRRATAQVMVKVLREVVALYQSPAPTEPKLRSFH